MLLPIGVTFAILADPLVNLFYGGQYEAAVAPLRWLGVMTVFYGINLLAAIVLVARDRPLDFARICGIVVALNLALNLALIPPLGATGAALAAAASSIVLAVLGVRRISSLTGRLNLLRSFAGPVLAGAVMAGAMLVSPLPFVPTAVLGVVLYAVVLLLVERRVHPDDFDQLRRLVRSGRRSRPEPAISAMEVS